MKDKKPLEFQLKLGETALLLCLTLETGQSMVNSILEIERHFPGTFPFSTIKKLQLLEKKQLPSEIGQALIFASQKSKKMETKAFFALLAVAELSGMSIGQNLRWMSDVFSQHTTSHLTSTKKRNQKLLKSITVYSGNNRIDFDELKKYFDL